MAEHSWKYYPACKLSILLAAGIVTSRLLDPTAVQAAIVLAAVLAWLAAAVLRNREGMLAPIAGVLLAAGALSASLVVPDPLMPYAGTEISDAELLGRVTDGPALRGGELIYTVACDSFAYRNTVVHHATRAIVRLRDRTPFDPAILPHPGDLVSTVGSLNVPGPPVIPGGFDERAWCAARGVGLIMRVSRAAAIHIVRRSDEDLPAAIIRAVRGVAMRFADSMVGGEEGDIVRALLIGDRSGIDQQTARVYARAGVVHILSVSGFHVGVLALALFVATSWLRSRVVQLVAFALLLGAYAAVAGADPPILRAAIMAVAALLARVAGRPVRPLNTLGAAALVTLALRPGDLFDVGFQLSYAATAGVLLLHGRAWRALAARVPLAARWRPLGAVLQTFVMSVCAQLFTLPLLLYHFGSVSVVGLVVNIVVVPLFAIALAAALAGAMLTAVAPQAAYVFGGTTYAAVHLAGLIVDVAAALPLASVTTGPVGLAGALATAFAVIAVPLSRTLAQALLRTANVVMVAFVVATIARATDPLHAPDVRVVLLPFAGRTAVLVVEGARGTCCFSARGAPPGAAAALMRTVEPLCARMALEPIAVVDVAGDLPARASPADDARSSLLVMSAAPRAVVLRGAPLLLVDGSAGACVPVMVCGERLLRVPLGAALDRAIVLRYRAWWESVAW